jgi:hypothetical protein
MIEWQGEGKAMVKLNAINRQAEPVPMNATTIGGLLKQLKEQKGVVEQPVAKAA